MARPRKFDEAEVVAQATQVFFAKGYRRTTPQDLLDATGLSKSSLYNTFGNKEGLFARALDQYADMQREMLGGALDRPTLRESLESMYEQVVRTSAAVEHGGMGMSCLMCTATLEVEPCEPDLIDQVRQGRANAVGLIADRLERAQVAGELPKDSDPGDLAAFLYNTNMGLVVLGRAGTPTQTLRAVATQAIQAVLG